jgi:putative ATP-binding cassette transporter
MPRGIKEASLFRETGRLLRPFWSVAVFSTVMGALGGIATAWLLATINTGLHAAAGIDLSLLLRFTALCLLSVGGSAIAGIGNSIVGQKVIAALRKDISGRILRAPLALIEQQRNYRLMAVMTNDVDTISAFTFNFSGYAVAFAIVLGSMVYLLVLSPLALLLVIGATFLGIVINIYAKRGWIRDYEGVRSATDQLQKQYRAVIEGAKELRLNRDRRSQVHDLLLSGAADRIAGLKIRAMRLFWAADAAGAAIFFVVIGLLLLMQPALDLDAAVISGTILVLLYIKGPVEQIANGLPVLGQAQVSLRRIATLSADFGAGDLKTGDPGTAGRDRLTAVFARAIELRDVSYAFPGEENGGGFALGPLDLTIRRGETVFIAGENGSGKTTLIKLLLGLYRPGGGALLLDGAPVPAEALDEYRQLFSAVFSDYFLFDDLVAAGPDLARQAKAYLTRMEIGHKVRIENGAFTTTDLSSGQRKRLALIHAYLEQRPIMMFDEWAADQDPTFRRVFYSELLPDLKRQGKTLIVISHDDRYFDAADRIIRLQDGRIVEEEVPNRPSLSLEA